VGDISIYRDQDMDGQPDTSSPVAGFTGKELADMAVEEDSALHGGVPARLVSAPLPSPVGIDGGASLTLLVSGTFSHPGLMNSSFGVRLSPVQTGTDAVLSINSDLPMGATGATSYIGGAPDEIVVDGAFADWDGVTNVDDSDETPVGNANVDITSFAASGVDGGLAFFTQVKGDMLEGAEIPYAPRITTTHIWLDADEDGVPDSEDPNPDDATDTDNDGWSDDYENIISLTEPDDPDTDGDLVADPQDVAPHDPSIPPLPEGTELPALGQDTVEVYVDADGDPAT
jgi:hypothetical protein